jgi:two-component sensor histidine kinase
MIVDSTPTRPQAFIALREIARALSAAWDLDTTLDLIARKTTEVMHVDSCTIYLLDPDDATLRLRASTGLAQRALGRATLSVGEGLTGRAVSRNEPVFAADAQYDPNFKWVDHTDERRFRSLLAIPLVLDARPIGALNVQTATPHHYTQDEIDVLMLVGDLAAGALAKAQLYDRQKRQLDELQTVQNAQLATNAAVMREMHHRIKNNLQTVAMLMQLQIPDAGQLDARRVLETNIHRIRSIAAVHEILSEKGFRLVDVKDVLERIAQTTSEQLTMPQQNITIAVHGENLELTSRAATALAVVVNELVQNSLEHAFAGREEGHINISLGRGPESLIVLVRDDGVGLPDEYERSLGLEIAEALVQEDLDGSLRFNRLESGTEVSIRLPRSIERVEP